MASSVTDDDIPRDVWLQWYEIRDNLVGQNNKMRSLRRALELAASCQHPDARWLIDALDMRRERTQASFFLLSAKTTLARCVSRFCLAMKKIWLWLRCDAQPSLVTRLLKLSWHKTQKAWRSSSLLSWLAAAQGERDGYWELGWCFWAGDGCEKDLEKAKQNLLLASLLNHGYAMVRLGTLLAESNAMDPMVNIRSSSQMKY
jgi:hypothetical protein